MNTYVNYELAKLLIQERLVEADEARLSRIVRKTEQNRTLAPRRSILDLFRRQSLATCAC